MIGPFSEQELAKAVSGDGETTGLGRAKLLRSQLGISFSSCLMTMVSITKKRSHGSHSVCSWVMKGARSKCRIMEIPPIVTRSKLLRDGTQSQCMQHPICLQQLSRTDPQKNNCKKYLQSHFTNLKLTAQRGFSWQEQVAEEGVQIQLLCTLSSCILETYPTLFLRQMSILVLFWCYLKNHTL